MNRREMEKERIRLRNAILALAHEPPSAERVKKLKALIAEIKKLMLKMDWKG